MGELTRAEYEERVLLSLGNMPTSHPVIAAGMHTSALNNSANRLIRQNPDRFPEHLNRSWTIGPTNVSDNRVALPENMLILERVRSNALADDPTVDPGDWSSVQEQVVSMVRLDSISLTQKESTTGGFPVLCEHKANDLLYWPTTRTGYPCYLRLYGTSGEMPLAASGSTFRMHRDFDQAIVLLAAAEVAEAIGWYEKAAALTTLANERLESTVNVTAKERAGRRTVIRVAGEPGGRW